MGKYYYNGMLKSLEETKSSVFSPHSIIVLSFMSESSIFLYPSPQLHQSYIVIHNSTQRCSSDNTSCWAEDF